MSVGLVGEDDQIAINFAVITEVLLNTSSIAAKGAAPLQEHLDVNAILVVVYDKVPMYMLARRTQKDPKCVFLEADSNLS